MDILIFQILELKRKVEIRLLVVLIKNIGNNIRIVIMIFHLIVQMELIPFYPSAQKKNIQVLAVFNNDFKGGCQWTYGTSDKDASVLNQQLAFPTDIIESNQSNRRYACKYNVNYPKHPIHVLDLAIFV